jgi:predicted transcriptional regulator
MALTRQELQIMRIVWQRGEVTVRAVYEEIRTTRHVAYTTIMTTMNILEREGRLTKRLSGRAFMYTSVDSRDQAVEEILREFVDRVFDGSVSSLLELLSRTQNLRR